MAFEIDRLVAAIDPVAVAVVGGLRLARDRRASLARALAVRVDIVDVDTQRLGAAPRALGASTPVALLIGIADHDEAATEYQLGVRDLAALSFDLELHLEAKRATQPVDR